MTTTDLDLPVHPTTGLAALAVIGGRPVWPVLGAAPDDGGDDQGDRDGDQLDHDGDQPPAEDDQDGQDAGGGDQDDEPLGAAGRRALAAERERRRAEARRRRELEAELDQLRTKNGGGDEAEAIRRQAEQAATAKANARVVRAEVRAAAAGKLADPADALRFLDLDAFEVGEDGVDADEIAEAIDDLIRSKPYLAAATAKRFQGTADNGAARRPVRPRQLTRQDLQSMTPEQIDKAREEGRLADLMGGK